MELYQDSQFSTAKHQTVLILATDVHRFNATATKECLHFERYQFSSPCRNCFFLFTRSEASFCDVALFYRISVHVYGATSRQGGATRPTSTHTRTYTYKIKLMCTSERKCTYKRRLKYTYKRTAAHASSLPYFHHLEKTEPE